MAMSIVEQCKLFELNISIFEQYRLYLEWAFESATGSFPKHGYYHFLNKASAWFVSQPGGIDKD